MSELKKVIIEMALQKLNETYNLNENTQLEEDVSESLNEDVSIIDIILEEVSEETLEAIMSEISEETFEILSELTGKGKLDDIEKKARERSRVHGDRRFDPSPDGGRKNDTYHRAYKAAAVRAAALKSGDKETAKKAKAAQDSAGKELRKHKADYYDQGEPAFQRERRKAAKSNARNTGFDGSDMYDKHTGKTKLKGALSGKYKIGTVIDKAANTK